MSRTPDGGAAADGEPFEALAVAFTRRARGTHRRTQHTGGAPSTGEHHRKATTDRRREAIDLGCRQRVDGAPRVEPGPPQDLVDTQVAEAGHDLLIEER